jgi:hypothetical protein
MPRTAAMVEGLRSRGFAPATIPPISSVPRHEVSWQGGPLIGDIPEAVETVIHPQALLEG